MKRRTKLKVIHNKYNLKSLFLTAEAFMGFGVNLKIIEKISLLNCLYICFKIKIKFRLLIIFKIF